MKWISVEEGLPTEDCLCIVLVRDTFWAKEYPPTQLSSRLDFRAFTAENANGTPRKFPFGVQCDEVIAYFIIPKIPLEKVKGKICLDYIGHRFGGSANIHGLGLIK